jgi:hypothetical protein
MKPKHVYAILAVAGAILPLWQFAPFLRDHGLDVRYLLGQLFATPASSFFAVDVIVSSVVLWAFVFSEGKRTGVRQRWVPVLASLTVGVSLALPLFLYMRELRIEQSSNARSWVRRKPRAGEDARSTRGRR